MSSEGWSSITIRSPNNTAAAIRALFALGAEGVQELDGGIVTHIRGLDRARALQSLRALSSVPIEFGDTPTTDWSRDWRAGIRAHGVGKLVVTPPWEAHRFPATQRIVIEPGMAFGTGEHETTRGVLRLMQIVVNDGDVVADLGAGSAVLAIAAAKLGARRVVAIELDPDAIGNAEANVAANHVGAAVSVIEGDAFSLLPLIAPVRLVFANIISSVLVNLLPVISSALTPDGVAILSGILQEERDVILEALRAGGWRVRAEDHEGVWWSVLVGV